MSGADEAYVGRRVFTSSENVRTDDAEVGANEQMMKNARGGERESFLSARWRTSWHLSRDSGYGFSCITPARTAPHAHVQSRLLSLRATCPAPGHQSVHPCVFDGG